MGSVSSSTTYQFWDPNEVTFLNLENEGKMLAFSGVVVGIVEDNMCESNLKTILRNSIIYHSQMVGQMSP